MPTPSEPGLDVPVIDIGPYTGVGDPAGREPVARLVDDACRRVGFLQVVNHGIAPEVIGGLADAIDDFFALPPGRKDAYRLGAATNRGYSPPRSEALSLSAGVLPAADVMDYFEAFNVGVPASTHPGLDLPADHYMENVWPTEVDGFQDRVSAYFAEAARVARVLTGIFADALGLPADFFAGHTDHSIEILRMNNYALPEVAVEEAPGGDGPTGMGEHTDFGIVTVLWADPRPGLQVLGPDRQWHDVVPAPGALLVNLGDLMARWTDDRWMSTLHRVRPPVQAGRVQRRRSAAFFHDGNADAVVTTIAGDRPGASTGYDPISVDEHIRAKLEGSRGGIVNRAATREAARILAAQGER